MTDPDPILCSLGITPRAPFDWGDEPHAKLEPFPKSSPSDFSGLDTLKQFVQDKSCDDDRVKRVLTSLLVKANVPLTTENSVDKSPNRKRYFDLLEGDRDVSSRDVSIRGLSDRACAELTVESRSSLFGSVLRIFDIDREVKKPDPDVAGKAASIGAAETTNSAADKSGTPKSSDAANKSSDATSTSTAVSSSIDTSGNVAAGTNVTAKQANETESIPVAAKVNTVKKTDSPTATAKTDTEKPEAAPVPVISAEIMEAAKNNPTIAHAPILSTAEIVRFCHLTASPGDIPPCMDSKEYTMAALHFLSSHVPFISERDDETKRDKNQSLHSWKIVTDTFPILPLLTTINPEESLEKRVYGRVKPLIELGKEERKQYPDSMDSDPEFRRKVLNLERAFTSSLPFTSKTSSQPATDDIPLAFQRYVPRRKLCPRIETEGVKEELTLMISGHVQQEH
jgi:hypothetical protein